MRRRGRPLLIVMLAVASGCRAAPTAGRRVHSVSRDGDTTYLIASDDPQYRIARRQARCTLGELLRRLDGPRRPQSVRVKGAFRSGRETEHLWLDVLDLGADTTFRATVANDPALIPTLSYGDTVRLPVVDLDDWYVIERDTVVGGFSIRVHRDGLPPTERASYDRRLGVAGFADPASLACA